MQDAHNAEIAVIQRPEEQIVTLVTTEIGLTLYVGWHSKPLRKTPPEKTIVAETVQVRVQPSQVGLGLRFAPLLHCVTPNFILRCVRRGVKTVHGHDQLRLLRRITSSAVTATNSLSSARMAGASSF